MSISCGGKGGRCVRLTTLPLSCAVVTKSGNLNFLEPSRHLGPVMGLIYLYLCLTLVYTLPIYLFKQRISTPKTQQAQNKMKIQSDKKLKVISHIANFKISRMYNSFSVPITRIKLSHLLLPTRKAPSDKVAIPIHQVLSLQDTS